jgi:hypothetical protein
MPDAEKLKRLGASPATAGPLADASGSKSA